MKPSVFSLGGNFYKGNLHTHSNKSDGKLDPKEVCLRYKNAGYEIFVFKHPNLNSSFYSSCDVIPKEKDIFSYIERSHNEDVIISSSLTLSLLLPFLDRKFAILFDKSIIESKLYPDIVALKSLFPKNTFIKKNVKNLLYHSKVDPKLKIKIQNLFLK